MVLALAWEPDNDRFFFARGFPLQFSSLDCAGILTDVDPPSSDLSFVHKRMELRGHIENCVTGPRAMGFMEVFVDRVFVNQSAVSP